MAAADRNGRRNRRELRDSHPVEPVHEVREVHEPEAGHEDQQPLNPKRRDTGCDAQAGRNREQDQSDRGALEHKAHRSR